MAEDSFTWQGKLTHGYTNCNCPQYVRVYIRKQNGLEEAEILILSLIKATDHLFACTEQTTNNLISTTASDNDVQERDSDCHCAATTYVRSQ